MQQRKNARIRLLSVDRRIRITRPGREREESEARADIHDGADIREMAPQSVGIAQHAGDEVSAHSFLVEILQIHDAITNTNSGWHLEPARQQERHAEARAVNADLR